MYKIDRNIPVPKKVEHISKYPFKKLKVGDSFFVSVLTEKNKSLYSLKSKIYSQYKKFVISEGKLIELRFCIDRVNKGVRIFRTI